MRHDMTSCKGFECNTCNWQYYGNYIHPLIIANFFAFLNQWFTFLLAYMVLMNLLHGYVENIKGRVKMTKSLFQALRKLKARGTSPPTLFLLTNLAILHKILFLPAYGNNTLSPESKWSSVSNTERLWRWESILPEIIHIWVHCLSFSLVDMLLVRLYPTQVDPSD